MDNDERKLTRSPVMSRSGAVSVIMMLKTPRSGGVAVRKPATASVVRTLVTVIVTKTPRNEPNVVR